MADIHYIVVSDLHLGASNSILTKLTDDCQGTAPHESSDVLQHYVACLLDLVASNAGTQPVTLILNGDFLELALAGVNESAMVFERFMVLLLGDPRAARLSPRILCLAGNHDHHIWNVARENRYTDHYLANCAPGDFLRHENFVTPMVEGPELKKIEVDFLTTLVARHPQLKSVVFETVYPNYALLSPDKKRCVVIHHGHFVEPIYSLMTYLKDTLFPERDEVVTLPELEAENGAWIDFFWSTLGRSGEVGTDVELVYDKMQDARQFEALLRNLATNVAPHVPPKWRPFGFLKTEVVCILLRVLLGRIARREVHETGSVLSSDAKVGLARYLEVFLLPALRGENEGTVPPDLTFIFGHTHKPFEHLLRVDGCADQVQVLNSGGWVTDTLHPDPLHGAAIIVVDQDLNAASVRLYNEEEPADQQIKIVSARPANPLVTELQSRLKTDSPTWRTLRQSALAAIPKHRQNLEYKVKKETTP